MIDVKQILDAGKALGVNVQEVAGIPVALVDGKVVALENVLGIADQRAAAPRALRGTSKHTELGSFCAHVNRFKDEKSAIFADTNEAAPSLTAVLDYSSANADGGPRWGKHRSVYVCPLSRQWRAWMAIDGKELDQDKLGDFFEEHIEDFASRDDLPKAAELVTMARNLQVLTRGEFQRTLNPTTGAQTLINKVEHDQTSTKIHPRFLIGIPVFDAGTKYAIEAVLRMSLKGRPFFTISFPNAPAALRDAFNDVRDTAQTATGLPVFAGTPE